MARDHARIQVSIWSDPDFRKLPVSAQHMYLMLLSQPRLSYCGVIDYVPVRLSQMSSNLSVRSTQSAVNTLVTRQYVSVDPETSELLIRTFVRHDGLLTSPNVTKAMVKDYLAVLSDRLKKVIEKELSRVYAGDSSLKGWPAVQATSPHLFEIVQNKGSRKGSGNG